MEPPSNLSSPTLSTETRDDQTVIPDFVVDSLARCLLPKLRTYYDSPEGQAAFEKWQQQHST